MTPTNTLLAVLQEMLLHRDSLEMRAPREDTDKHLLPIPLAPATWADLRELVGPKDLKVPRGDPSCMGAFMRAKPDNLAQRKEK